MKTRFFAGIFLVLTVLAVSPLASCNEKKCDDECQNGHCDDGQCVCDDGYSGKWCETYTEGSNTGGNGNNGGNGGNNGSTNTGRLLVWVSDINAWGNADALRIYINGGYQGSIEYPNTQTSAPSCSTTDNDGPEYVVKSHLAPGDYTVTVKRYTYSTGSTGGTIFTQTAHVNNGSCSKVEVD